VSDPITTLPPTTLPATTEEREQALAVVPEPKKLDALHTEHGDTLIADQVVQKIAGIAAREVAGVHAMGSAAGRALTNLAQRIPGSKTNVAGGVSVAKGERQTAIDVSIVVEYGVAIAEVAEQIRQSIITGVEYATGLEVLEVNVSVTDVHLPDEDDDAPAPAADQIL
jgi:uncharacterized alkaline shock family protein YloU